MKRLLLSVVLSMSLVLSAPAEVYVQTWGPVTQTGPLSPARNHQVYGLLPSNYTISWYNDGSAATACTFQAEGSGDGKPTHQSALTSSIDCTSSVGMVHIANKPVVYLQIDVLTFGAADSTTKVYFTVQEGR